ncbi:hypothetical protein ACIOWI_34825 [Streptomyces sp. NPDC087659]|uniref:hypothetical protein n=1 Tax=Streptomyces sp. NPDC087659 TaxID=3365801 RepID=UPI00381ECD72
MEQEGLEGVEGARPTRSAPHDAEGMEAQDPLRILPPSALAKDRLQDRAHQWWVDFHAPPLSGNPLARALPPLPRFIASNRVDTNELFRVLNDPVNELATFGGVWDHIYSRYGHACTIEELEILQNRCDYHALKNPPPQSINTLPHKKTDPNFAEALRHLPANRLYGIGLTQSATVVVPGEGKSKSMNLGRHLYDLGTCGRSALTLDELAELRRRGMRPRWVPAGIAGGDGSGDTGTNKGKSKAPKGEWVWKIFAPTIPQLRSALNKHSGAMDPSGPETAAYVNVFLRQFETTGVQDPPEFVRTEVLKILRWQGEGKSLRSDGDLWRIVSSTTPAPAAVAAVAAPGFQGSGSRQQARAHGYMTVALPLAGAVQRRFLEGNQEPDSWLSDYPRDSRGYLSLDAVARYVGQSEGHFSAAMSAVLQQAGVTVRDNISDADLNRLLTPADRVNYPELQSYLNRPDKRQLSDGNDPLVTTELYIGDVPVVLHHPKRVDRGLEERRRVFERALTLLQSAGYRLPPRPPRELHVHLPRYDRRIDVAYSQNSQTPLRITQHAIGAVPPYSGAFFCVPRHIILSAVMGDVIIGSHGVQGVMEDKRLGVMIHELIHWYHWSSNPYLYADLEKTHFATPRLAQIAGMVSDYAATDARVLVAELGLAFLLGRPFEVPVKAELDALYDRLGGPRSTTPNATITPPPPTTTELAHLYGRVTMLLQGQGIRETPTPVVITAAHNSLSTFHKWTTLEYRAHLITEYIRSRQLAAPIVRMALVGDEQSLDSPHN